MNTERYVEALIERQKAENWSLREFAREAGIHHTTWYGITTGRQQPGMQTLRALMRRFPEYTWLLFLPSDVSDSHDNVTDTNGKAA